MKIEIVSIIEKNLERVEQCLFYSIVPRDQARGTSKLKFKNLCILILLLKTIIEK